MKIADLRIKIQRQAEKLKSFHKKVKEDKKKNATLLSIKNRSITCLRIELDNMARERDLWIRDYRAISTKVNEKHETIIGLQRALLKVTDQREDAIAKVVTTEVAYLSEIKKLNKYIETLQPKKKSMLKTSAISKIIKNTGGKNAKELQETGISR